MPKFVLYYFDLAGRAEISRLLFHHAGVEFEDHRFKKDEWAEMKKNQKLFPFGQCPSLEVDGEVIAQSATIARYLANEFGLNGKTNMEKAKNDMIFDGLRDVGQKLINAMKQKDEETKEAMKKDFWENQVQVDFKLFEERFAPQNGFFTGDSVALADIAFFGLLSFWEEMFHQKPYENFPKLKALHDRVAALPNIKKYLDSRKK
ncbi:glutathione S-transferase 1-like [Rhopilema esculentum]|uniref:glutathione S-transferase 1-like n=1 Tax=Rhopilema esculentum TaxID=499914 RepID=UPI0031E159A0|eukprot:gene8197-14131_t